jgi:hypothetical protein
MRGANKISDMIADLLIERPTESSVRRLYVYPDEPIIEKVDVIAAELPQ